MTVSVEVRELAAGTAAEIRRRGWSTGDLVIERDEWTEPDGTYVGPDADSNEYIRECKVCILGGMSAAYCGNPRRGYDLDGALGDLVAEVADRVYPEWDEEGVPATEAVFLWNDSRGTADDVLELLDSIAAPAADAA